MIPEPPNLAREPAFRRQRENFTVFLTRGLPEHYLHWIKAELQHHTIASQYVRERDALENIVKAANDYDEEAAIKGSQVDQIWCLVEGVTPRVLGSLATDSRVQVASSWPTVESWLLLHFEDADATMSTREAQARLRRHMPGLEKDIYDGALLGRFDGAAERASNLGTGGRLGSDLFRFVEQVRNSLVLFDPEATVRI